MSTDIFIILLIELNWDLKFWLLGGWVAGGWLLAAGGWLLGAGDFSSLPTLAHSLKPLKDPHSPPDSYRDYRLTSSPITTHSHSISPSLRLPISLSLTPS